MYHAIAFLNFTICVIMICHDLRLQELVLTWGLPVCLKKAENPVLQMCTGCNSLTDPKQ